MENLQMISQTNYELLYSKLVIITDINRWIYTLSKNLSTDHSNSFMELKFLASII